MKRRNLWITFGLVFILVATFIGLQQKRTFSTVLERKPADSGEFSYEDLKTLIQSPSHPIQSIDALISALPEAFTSNFVLVHTSESIQASNPSHPRIIFYGQDAKLVLGVSSFQGSTGFNRVEVMRFQDDTAQFEFKEIVFPNPGQKLSVAFQEHPDSCVNCHGFPTKPIWSSYFLWPGVYGSFDDKIYPNTQEASDFKEFYSTIGKRSHTALKPHGLRPLALPKNEADYRPFPMPNSGFFEGFNARLTGKLASLNFKSIAKSLRDLPEFSRFKYAIMATGLNCPRFQTWTVEDLIPENLHFLYSEKYQDVLTDTKNKMAAGQAEQLIRYRQSGGAETHELNRNFDDNTSLSQADTVAGLRYIVEPLGMYTSDWSMNRERGSYLLFDGAAQFRLPLFILSDGVEPNDDLNALFPGYSDPKYQDPQTGAKNINAFIYQCEALKDLSLRALALVDRTALETAIESYKRQDASKRVAPENVGSIASVGSCITCHSGANPIAPPIPFDDPARLIDSLSRPLTSTDNRTLHDEISYRIDTNGDDRMPKGRVLTEQEKVAIHAYIDGLASSR